MLVSCCAQVFVQEVLYSPLSSHLINYSSSTLLGFPGGSVVKNLPSNAGHVGLISGSGKSHGEGNGNSLQYSCLGYPMNRGAWWAIVHGVAELDMTKQQNNNNIFY